MPAQQRMITKENSRFEIFCTYYRLDENGLRVGEGDYYYRLVDLEGRPFFEGPYAPSFPNTRPEDQYPEEGLFHPYELPRL